MAILTTTVARVLFSLPFIVLGANHFFMSKQMAGMVPSFIPGGVFWVYFTGICLVAAGISIITQKHGALACKLLAALLGIFVLTIHLPGMGAENPMMRGMVMVNMLKDLGLIGGALTYAGIFENQGG